MNSAGILIISLLSSTSTKHETVWSAFCNLPSKNLQILYVELVLYFLGYLFYKKNLAPATT